MKKTMAGIIILAALLAGCTTPTPSPTATATPPQVAIEPTPTPPPTSTPVPSPTPTTSPTDPGCVRATAQIPEGQNPTQYVTSGPAAGCHDGLNDFLGDIALSWEEFEPGLLITLWTQWPVDAAGMLNPPTPTPLPTYTLSGTVFFDYNGNGLRDSGEPPIESVGISVGGLSTTGGADGSYSVAGVSAGSQRVYVESPTDGPATAFRYINKFLGWVDIPAYEMNGVSVPSQRLADTQFQPMDQPLGVVLPSDQTTDVALMQGFLTLPFRAQEAHLYWLTNYVDLDVTLGSVRNFEGNANMSGDPRANPGLQRTTDQHYGIDYDGPENASVANAAPGTVSYIRADLVAVDHLSPYQTNSGHLNMTLVALGQKAYRGQIMGLNGTYDTEHPHIHFGLYNLRFDRDHPYPTDPYMDLVDNDFRYLEYKDMEQVGYRPGTKISVGSPGYWTKTNDPQDPS